MKFSDMKGNITIHASPVPLPVEGMWFFGANLQHAKHGYNEPATANYLRSHLGSDKTFIDIGANYGYYSVLAGKLGARVIAYEPDKLSFSRLKRNLLINRIPKNKTQLHNAAVSDTQGEASFFIDHAGSGLNSLVADVLKNPTEMKVRTEICSSPYDLCKIDVEGAELQVLKSIAHKGTVICEFRPEGLDRMGVTPDFFLSSIRELGWRIEDLQEGSMGDAELTAKARRSVSLNILLLR